MVVRTEVSGPQNVYSIKMKLLKTHYLDMSQINDTIKQLVFDNLTKKNDYQNNKCFRFYTLGKIKLPIPSVENFKNNSVHIK